MRQTSPYSSATKRPLHPLETERDTRTRQRADSAAIVCWISFLAGALVVFLAGVLVGRGL